MIVDITGIILAPGNLGNDCLGNGKYFHVNGTPIDCCCDECDYLMCCSRINNSAYCLNCKDEFCPRKNKKSASD